MDNFTISIFDNKTFFEIIKEIKLFSEYNIKHYENYDSCANDAEKENHLVVFFINSKKEIKMNSFPTILITHNPEKLNELPNSITEQLVMPFSILDLKKKIISLIAKNKFMKNSLIDLKGYTIDKNERKIKKNNLELQLSEKEINFLVLFSEIKEPINRNEVLKNVWKYSDKSETHTVETHIHRLRKKIFQKFGDNDFIKNNNKGYFI